MYCISMCGKGGRVIGKEDYANLNYFIPVQCNSAVVIKKQLEKI